MGHAAAVACSSPRADASAAGLAESVVRAMYTAINDGDYERAKELIDEECLYEDLNFPDAFKGKEVVGELFRESVESCPDGMRFVIDDATGDDGAVGVSWHCEVRGRATLGLRNSDTHKIARTK